MWRRRGLLVPGSVNSSLVRAGFVPASGFPDATNTGVPAGTSLTPHSGTYNTSADNEIVQDLLITGSLVIQHANVLVRRCKITAQAPSNSYSIFPDTGGVNATIQDCEVDGGITGITGLKLQNGIQLYRVAVHGCENGASCASNSAALPVLLQDSYIYDLAPEGSGFHTDGIEFDSNASYLTIEHTTIRPILSGIRNATSCINFNNQVGGTNNHMLVNNSLIDGRGTATPFYLPRYSGWSLISITNNRLRAGDGGYNSNGGGAEGTFQAMTAYTGNVDDATGATVTQTD